MALGHPDALARVPDDDLKTGAGFAERVLLLVSRAAGPLDERGATDPGVWVSCALSDGSYAPPLLGVGNFAYNAGGWRVGMHPRMLADLNGNGMADIVGFGNAGVWVSFAKGDGTFADPQLVIGNFGYDAGGWRVDQHPRLVADTTGDGRPDIVGFGNAGVWVSRNQGDGSFAAPQLVVGNFGVDAGWRVDRHPRFVADTTGEKGADIVGFGTGGIWVSRNRGTGSFEPPRLILPNFGYDAGGWRVDVHPRFVADVTGDHRADIVGFGNAGVWLYRS